LSLRARSLRPFYQAAAWFGQQRISALAVHRREIERNSAPVVLLRQPLILKVCKIPANGVRRNLQLFNEVADTDLTMFTNDIKQVFLTSGFMHLRLILQNVAINRILQHFDGKP
jgi:hypothetical protein